MSKENVHQNFRISLVNPPATYVNEVSQKCYPPASLLYLAASLKSKGFVTQVIDANAFALSHEQIARQLQDFSPHLVGFSVYSEILPQIRSLIAVAKHAVPTAKIILGGPHATAIPETTLTQFSMADYVLTGEAEDSLPALGEHLVRQADISRIPGIYFRSGHKILGGPPHEFPDIHTIPLPDKNLISKAYKKKKYHSLLVRKRPVDTLFSSRGCPFSCGFCYNFRHTYRARTPEDVVEEIASIRDRGIRDVEICDDTFTVNEDRALKIFDLIVKEKLDVSFRIKSRVDVFTEKLARQGKKAGVYMVSFGMESANQRLLDIMNKKITVKQMAEACHLTASYKIACHSSWVIGYPGETPDTIEETLGFIKKHRPTTANIAVLRPYPNTPAYYMAKDTNSLHGEWSPDATEFPWVELPWAKERQILDDICKNMLLRIYFTPYYTGSFGLRMIRGANWMLFRYALQETAKAMGFTRKT